MARRASLFIGIFASIAFIAFGSRSVSRAVAQEQPALASSPYDLINAVNVLRASYGLAPYNINSILMYTAQAQADFLAATESMTHSGPGGISVTDRLLATGYPLAGDLSLGGFRSENITGGSEKMPAQAAVDSWTGDSLHLNTMISPNLTEIGAGVAVNNGRVYYVIDCALPTTSGASQAEVTSSGNETSVPADAQVAIIDPVTHNTPNGEGDVIHEVKSGQTLWQIAIAYEVRIDEIKGLNNLSDNNIYPGDKLLIKRGTGMATDVPTQAASLSSTSLPISTATVYSTSTVTPTVLVSSVSTNNAMIMKVVMGILALTLLGGGIFAWLGGAKKEKSHRLK